MTRTVLWYESEIWTFMRAAENLLDAFKRIILCKILGPGEMETVGELGTIVNYITSMMIPLSPLLSNCENCQGQITCSAWTRKTIPKRVIAWSRARQETRGPTKEELGRFN